MNAIPLITAAPILRPQYVTTPETAGNYKRWLRVNFSAVWGYWKQLDAAEPFENVAPDEFAAIQWDCERAKLLALTEVRS